MWKKILIGFFTFIGLCVILYFVHLYIDGMLRMTIRGDQSTLRGKIYLMNEPIKNVGLSINLDGNKRTMMGITDSNGIYSISLVPGVYLIEGFNYGNLPFDNVPFKYCIVVNNAFNVMKPLVILPGINDIEPIFINEWIRINSYTDGDTIKSDTVKLVWNEIKNASYYKVNIDNRHHDEITNDNNVRDTFYSRYVGSSVEGPLYINIKAYNDKNQIVSNNVQLMLMKEKAATTRN